MREVYFLSDFGLADPYAAVVKAVMRQVAPGLAVHDLAHNLPPGDLRRASYILYESVPYLPRGAVVLAVVDPGVGSSRRAVLVLGERLFYVAPDNGLLTLAYLQDPPKKAYLLEDPAYHLPRKSSTFHGRDVFGPVAAHLAAGVEPQRFGPELPVRELLRLPIHLSFGRQGEVLTFDRFGNAITTLLTTPAQIRGKAVCIRYHRIPVATHYAEVPVGAALAYIGSAGLLELAVHLGNAREQLGLREGDPVELCEDRWD
ncbi:MAG: SAM-dependent chlorinase/fluorinase [Meiothermus sp.]|uniref:SAM hydrolase/SAM-dependent halogenase family protein n=1 Tax=Meiothermus sp. TaxID=1955249 RepID=UPI0025E5EE37|nr:SAM-dependent chlorinase/fluorinase [Meiothermus sp.]MCS7057917.1 SAM-dependent chlorinase/fluorinase [Meiothermus sp.]MCS7194207.1 SAM-dependent chlorinase/fluorinase [Meiothermus sp.]MCX7741162.1 SAM-dependent chlorinase/fluorinase [Meiothermus sp.]MDW8090068.1 SAM-dependent chlorinase/fluorinase [Meiothermus sp.]MDW8480716.1 SAM-dependent chlorinase/fluorinase [Meiothermus sp.]